MLNIKRIRNDLHRKLTPAVDKSRYGLPHIQAIRLLNQLNYQKIEFAFSLHYKYYSLHIKGFNLQF